MEAQKWDPRGVPETLETDQLAQAMGFDGTMQAIEAAARAPGYIMERPVAAASEITSGLARSMGLIQEDQDVLDMAGQAVRDIPFVGDHIGNGIGAAMGAFNTISDSVPTLLNARYARIADEISGMADDEPIPWQLSISIPESWNRIENVGQLREHMMEGLGWTPEMFAQIDAGEAGWLDFAWGPKTFANEFADAATRMVADPFNLMLGAGVVLKGVKMGNTALRALRAGTRMTANVRASTPLVGQAARMAIHKGAGLGVTSTGLGYSLVDMSRRFLAGPFASYRKVAIGTTGVQAGMQGVGQVAGAIGLEDTIIGDIGRIGESIAENKPLSENDLYMLAMIFTFPGGKMAKSGVKAIRKAPIVGIDNALWTRTETAGLRHLAKYDPEYAGLSDDAIRAKVIEEFGSIESYEAFLANAGRDAVALKEGLLNISDNAAVARRKIDNISALGFHVQAMQRRAMRRFGKALDEGSIRPADLVRALDHFVMSRGGVMEAALDGGQATRRQSVRKVAQTWHAYEKIAKELDEAFDGGAAIAPGINDTAYTVEGLAHIRQMLKDEIGAGDGMVSGEFLQDLLMTQPALIKHLGDAEAQKAFAGHKLVDGSKVLKKLDDPRVKDSAWTFDDLFGDTMRAWESGAQAAPSAARAVRTGTGRATAKLRAGEKLAGRYRPELSTSEVVVLGRGYQGVRSGGANPVTVGMVREARGLPENAAGMQATLSALRQAGYEVEASTQIVKMDGKAVNTGSAIRMGELTDITTLEQVAAVTLEQTGGTEALIIQRGTALDAHGLTRNAAEFQWDLPERLTEAQYDTLLQDVKRVFGDNVIVDDTNGVVRVIIDKSNPDPRLFAHLRAVTDATGVQPSVERLHVSKVRNGRKPLKKDPDGTRTVRDIANDAKSDPSGVRYRNATESATAWRRRYADELGRTDGVVGSRGPDAPADAIGPGGTAQDVGGSGARRATEGAPLTRYESLRGSQPIGRRGNYVVDAADPGVIAESTRVFGADGTIRPGDIAFRSDDGFFAVVRDGYLRVHRPRGGAGDWDDFLAHVSEYATYVRVPGKRTKRGQAAVFHPDTFAEHGWRPVARVAGREGDVFLVRDVAGEIGSSVAPEVPPVRLGGWAAVRDQVMTLDVQAARVTAQALADNLHGAQGARLRIPDVEAKGNQMLETMTPEEIRQAYRQKSDDPALQHAMRQLDDGMVEESAETAAYAVSATDVPAPTAGRIGPQRTYNLALTRKTATGKLRSHRRNANEMYSASRAPKKAGKVTQPVSVEVMRDPRSQLFLSDDGKAGAVVTADGDLVNVFGEGKDLNDILVEARELAYTATYPAEAAGEMARHNFVPVAEAADGTLYAVKRELMGEVPVTDATPTEVIAARDRLRESPSMKDDSFAPQDDMAWRNQNEDYFADNFNEFYEPFREGGEQITKHPYRIDYYGPDGNHVGYVTHDASGKISTVMVHPNMRGTGAGSKMLDFIHASGELDVVAGIGYSHHTPGGRALMESFLRRQGSEVPDVPLQSVGDPDTAWLAQREAMRAEGGRVPDDIHKASLAGEGYGQGVVEFIANREAEVANLLPKMHNSLEGIWGEMTPRQRMKMAMIEKDLRAMGSQYTLKATPAGSPSYFTGQGAAFRQVVGEWNQSYLGSKRLYNLNTMVADTWDKIMNPVYAAELNRLTTNTFFNTMQEFGVDNKTSKAILREMREKFDESWTVPWSGNKLFGRMEHLNGSLMAKVFEKHLTPEQGAAMKAAGVRPQDVIRRSSGRIYRYLNDRVGPLSEDGGNRALRAIEDVLYEGKTGAALQNLSVGTKIVYSIWRFALDPRWYLINRFEADILMGVRSGTRKALGIDFRGRRKAPHARTKGPGGDMLLAEESAMFQKQRRVGEQYAYADIDESMFGEQMQAGWMDMRSLNGYIAAGLEAEGRDATTRFMREMLEDPTNREIRDLIDTFESDGLVTPEQWADEFHRMLYEWDETGVRGTLDAEADKLGMRTAQYADMLDELYLRHQQSYLSMQRLMRGNINRNNLERILNNPVLYWPISYQLKAGKWMVDTLFNRFGGRETGMMGAGALTHWYDKHEQMMENDPGYAAIFNDHPAVWRMASQLVPMTPFDMGTYMARWTRYGTNWVAGTIDEDLRDERYPQDIMSFIERSAALGPAYSYTSAKRALDELVDEEDNDTGGSSGALNFRK